MNDNAALLRFLVELRKRLIYCLVVLAIIFLLLLYFTNSLYTLLAQPLLKYLPSGHGLIATNVTAPFFVPFELTWLASLFLAVPFFLYQLWAFIAPALYQNEKRLVWPLLITSTILFYIGIAFAYFIIFPITFGFLTRTAPQGVVVSPDISQYLDFSLTLFFTFGAIFEVPIAIILLVWSGITTTQTLKKIRPYAIVMSFVIGMMLTPDVLSQTLLALPLWFLFETGIFFSGFFKRLRA